MTRADRRRFLALAAALPVLGLAGPLAAQSADGPVLGDVPMGAEDAPLTVIEYASFTCPHCAHFHVRTFPQIKENYIDTGKVRFILREVYFDPYGLWASMLARCGGAQGFHAMADQLLKKQESWARSEDVAGELQKIGRLNGLSAAQMNACLSDQAFAEKLVAAYQENAERDGIRSTPSFVINGRLHSGAMGYEEFAALLDAAL